MASEQEPEFAANGKKNFLTIGLLIVIALMFVYAVFGDRGVMRILQAQQQKEQLQAQLEELRQEQDHLHEQIQRLQTDKNYWEQLARTKLGMVREGELIYFLPDQNNKDKRQKKE